MEIPYSEGVVLPAYLHLPPERCRLPGRKTPLVVALTGADSIQEEIYYTLPAEGPSLGYAVLTFDGPGQGLVLHEHGISMRPDWEQVTKLVVDHVRQQDDGALGEELGAHIDWDHVAVGGASLGAYFALRSAADNARFKACVAVDPLYDLYEFATKHVSALFFGLWERGWVPDGAVNSLIGMGTRTSFQMRWEIWTTSRFLGAEDPCGLLRQMRRYTLKGSVADDKQGYLERVQCPVLVTGAVDSLYFKVDEHSALVYEALSHPDKKLWVASQPGEGSLQAKVGAMALCNQRAYQFLDGVFNISREVSSSSSSSSSTP
jgi:pimeloyl-ACP methyl ester carboxylesterase